MTTPKNYRERMSKEKQEKLIRTLTSVVETYNCMELIEGIRLVCWQKLGLDCGKLFTQFSKVIMITINQFRQEQKKLRTKGSRQSRRSEGTV